MLLVLHTFFKFLHFFFQNPRESSKSPLRKLRRNLNSTEALEPPPPPLHTSSATLTTPNAEIGIEKPTISTNATTVVPAVKRRGRSKKIPTITVESNSASNDQHQPFEVLSTITTETTTTTTTDIHFSASTDKKNSRKRKQIDDGDVSENSLTYIKEENDDEKFTTVDGIKTRRSVRLGNRSESHKTVSFSFYIALVRTKSAL